MYVIAQVSRSLLILLLGTLMLAAVTAVGWVIRDHGRMLSVQTTSMTPTIYKGDAVIERAVHPQQLHVGDIVSYRSAITPDVTITHRIIKMDTSHSPFVTKGDHNTEADQPIAATQIIGRAFLRAPGLGRALDFEHHWLGLTATIYLPAFILASWEIAKVHRSYQHPHYRLYSAPSV